MTNLGLLTDLYQLTMAAGYWRAGRLGPATFELFVRRLPAQRGYLVAAGLDSALDYLSAVNFDDEARGWLRQQRQFARVPAPFFDDYLRTFRFTGDVWAVPEGTAVFEHEPVLRVTAPLPEAQLVETALLAIVAFQTSVATKAARLVDAARGRLVIEFGARRAHGLGAALDAARAAAVGGCDGTSLVEAARRYGLPVSGTMAHSWVEAFDSEIDAFRTFSDTFEESAVYLLDTYDTRAAARHLAASGLRPSSVRIDSGDLAAESRAVRGILDAGGLGATRIFATGDLDEIAIARLVDAGAPIDGFGVGTALTTVSDAPALAAVYKLVEVDRGRGPVGVAKLSPDKHTWPGAKQVWRFFEGGTMSHDLIAAADEAAPSGARPLLEPVMSGGRRARGEPLDAKRARTRATVASLPRSVRRLEAPDRYPVAVSATLEARLAAIRAAFTG